LSIKKLADLQKNQLMNDGMYGGKEVNAGMAIFLLKAVHGLRDQPQILQQFNVAGEMSLEFIGQDEIKSSSEQVATGSSEG
jgi:hypothetical protein